MATFQSENRSQAAIPDVESDTGERDKTYNLISTLYHALQGAESCAQYVRDAKRDGDEQLAQFFEEARGSQVELAQQAKLLLASRIDPTEVPE